MVAFLYKDSILGSQDDDVDILYKNPLVSRHHAAIQFNAKGGAFLVDLGSTHGTWKGGAVITNQMIQLISIQNPFCFFRSQIES